MASMPYLKKLRSRLEKQALSPPSRIPATRGTFIYRIFRVKTESLGKAMLEYSPDPTRRKAEDEPPQAASEQIPRIP